MTQTSSKETDLVRGQLLEQEPDRIVLALPGTDYRLHLQTAGAITTAVGKPLQGRITVQARRVDVVRHGGRYIEPVYGRPRRLQGRILAVDPQDNRLIVYCACSFVCRLMPGQKASDFAPGQLVSFDVERGATFEPAP